MINTNTTNYGSDHLVKANKAENVLEQKGDNEDYSIHVPFTSKPDIDHLIFQATTFALNFEKHGEYSLAKILRIRQVDLISTLKVMYIYSFLKALHDAWFSDSINADSDLGLVFKGHCKMYQLLTNPTSQNIKEGVYISSSINLGSVEERRISFSLLLVQLKGTIPDLNSFSSFGQRHFNIFEIEKYFAFLKTDYYAIRAHGEPVTNQQKGTKSFKQDDFPNGQLEICTLTQANKADVLDFKSLPIFNSFMNEERSKMYYIYPKINHGITNNSSFHLTNALFICADSAESLQDIVPKYFVEKTITEKQRFFVTSEVASVTGILCSNYADKPRGVSLPGGFKGIPVEDILTRVREYADKFESIDEIIETITTFIDETLKEDQDPGK